MKNKFKAVSTLITVILLVVVATIITVAILSWGNQFTNKSLDKTDGILDTKKYIENQIVVNSFVAATIEKTGNLNIKNLGPNNVTITGYTISDNEGNTEEITLDSEIEIITGASVIIPISTLLTGTKVSVVLSNSTNYFSLPTITKAPQTKPKVGNPSASLDSGYIPIDTEISLTPDNENDMIYYTTDGTDPTELSTKYTDPILISEDTVLKVIAIKENYIDSDIITYNYLIDGPLQLSLGENHSCVLLEGGKINCWGNNQKWQLGDETQDNRRFPVLVSDITNATEVSAGIIHTCVLLDTSEIACWGANDFGQLGVDTKKGYSEIPIVIPEIKGFTKIVVGGFSTCAINTGNELYCWGRNNYGQLGTGDTQDLLVPTKILENIRYVDIGINHTCAIDLGNNLYCWGDNQFGQLGDETQNPALTPKGIDFPDASTVKVGDNHTCATNIVNELYCWGDNQFGQLGGGIEDLLILTPTKISSNIISMDLGNNHGCLFQEKIGDIIQACWGKNEFSQLALPKDNDPHNNLEILKNILNIENTSLGANHTCSIINSEKSVVKEIYCWGDNSSGQIGVDSEDLIIETESGITQIVYIKKK